MSIVKSKWSAVAVARPLDRPVWPSGCRQQQVADKVGLGSRLAATARAYFELTKFHIIVLLLVTTLGSMMAARGDMPDLALVFWTLLGGALSAGAANTFNSYLDADLDRLMARTRRRPIPSGRVSPAAALRFGFLLAIASVAVLMAFVNPLATLLSTFAMAYYVLVYTAWLKRRSQHSVVIGGAAGAFPPVVGWVAATGQIDIIPLFLFAIVFFWTPPHAWALMLLVREDYRRAGVPTMPATCPTQATTRQVFLYSCTLFAITLVPAALRLLGPVYLVAALVLGTLFLLEAWALLRSPGPRTSKRLYKYSSLYLALLFLAVVLDRTFLA